MPAEYYLESLDSIGIEFFLIFLERVKTLIYKTKIEYSSSLFYKEIFLPSIFFSLN